MSKSQLYTEKEKDVVLAVISMGIACGLQHPFEWYCNYIRCMPMFMKYSDIPEETNILLSAFVKFLHACACHPEDPLLSINEENLDEAMEDWYMRKR